MKKVQLIEFAILAISLICGYKFIEMAYNTTLSLIVQLSVNDEYPVKYLLQSLFICGIYLGTFVLLVRNSKRLAVYINGISRKYHDFPEADEEPIPIRIGSTSLLYIILVALCLNSLIGQLPVLTRIVFHEFTTMFRNGMAERLWGDTGPGSGTIINPVIATVITCIILYFAYPLSKWFTSHLEGPVIETTEETTN
jgi:hypothetical protein